MQKTKEKSPLNKLKGDNKRCQDCDCILEDMTNNICEGCADARYESRLEMIDERKRQDERDNERFNKDKIEEDL